MSACLDKTFKIPEDIAKQWGFSRVRENDKSPEKKIAEQPKTTDGKSSTSFKTVHVDVEFKSLIGGQRRA